MPETYVKQFLNCPTNYLEPKCPETKCNHKTLIKLNTSLIFQTPSKAFGFLGIKEGRLAVPRRFQAQNSVNLNVRPFLNFQRPRKVLRESAQDVDFLYLPREGWRCPRQADQHSRRLVSQGRVSQSQQRPATDPPAHLSLQHGRHAGHADRPVNQQHTNQRGHM